MDYRKLIKVSSFKIHVCNRVKIKQHIMKHGTIAREQHLAQDRTIQWHVEQSFKATSTTARHGKWYKAWRKMRSLKYTVQWLYINKQTNKQTNKTM